MQRLVIVCIRAIKYMISWSMAGAFCGTMTGVLVSSMLWILGQDNFAENMGGGTLGGFYGGIPVGIVMGILDRSRAPYIKTYGGMITGTIGASIGSVISAVIIGGAMGAVAEGAKWGLLSGILGVIIGSIAGRLIGQHGYTQRTDRNSFVVRMGYWAIPGAVGGAFGGPAGRMFDTPDLTLSTNILLDAAGGGVLGGAVGSIVIGMFLVLAYDL